MGIEPNITLAGAISTGTHGSGADIGIMSAYVSKNFTMYVCMYVCMYVYFLIVIVMVISSF